MNPRRFASETIFSMGSTGYLRTDGRRAARKYRSESPRARGGSEWCDAAIRSGAPCTIPVHLGRLHALYWCIANARRSADSRKDVCFSNAYVDAPGWHTKCTQGSQRDFAARRAPLGAPQIRPNRLQRRTLMSPADVLQLIKDKGIKFVDLRLTDTRGKEQHVTVPSHTVDEAFFEDGKMFDGSSIAGWKGINESDMILMPDTSTAVVDVFSEEPTLNIRCDVIEPSTMQGYERDPRSLAKRAEAYLRSTGIADEAYFGPENEFFVFDDVRWEIAMHGASYAVDSTEGHWQSGKVRAEGNIGHRP